MSLQRSPAQLPQEAHQGSAVAAPLSLRAVAQSELGLGQSWTDGRGARQRSVPSYG